MKLISSKWIILLVIVAVIIFFSYSRASEDSEMNAAINTPSGSGSSSSSKNITDDTILKRGSRNAKVKALQAYYNDYVVKPPMTKLSVDGVFGPKTEAAVFKATGKKAISLKEFQFILNPFINGTISVNSLIG